MHFGMAIQTSILARNSVLGSRYLYRFYLCAVRASVGRDTVILTPYIFDWKWLRIGERVTLESGLTATPHDVMSKKDVKTVSFDYITIENDVLVGSESALHLNVSVGRGAVLDPLCRPMVSDSIPPGSRYCGVPGRVRNVGRRKERVYKRERERPLNEMTHLSRVSVLVVDVSSLSLSLPPPSSLSLSPSINDENVPDADLLDTLPILHKASSHGLRVVLLAPHRSSSWARQIASSLPLLHAIICEEGTVAWVRNTVAGAPPSDLRPFFSPVASSLSMREKIVQKTNTVASTVFDSLSLPFTLPSHEMGPPSRLVSMSVNCDNLTEEQWEMLQKRALLNGVSVSLPKSRDLGDGVTEVGVSIFTSSDCVSSFTKTVIRSLFSMSDASMQRECVFIGSVGGSERERDYRRLVSPLFDFFPRSVGISLSPTPSSSEDREKERKAVSPHSPSYLCEESGVRGWERVLEHIATNAGGVSPH